MNNIRNKYRALIIAVLIIMGLAISALYLAALSRIQDTYQQSAVESIIDVKKNFLKDTVNNVILEIEQKQKEQAEYYTHLANDMFKRLDRRSDLAAADFADYAREIFENNEYSDFSILITENQSGKLLYDNLALADATVNAEFINTMASTYPVFCKRTCGSYAITLGVSKDAINKTVQAQIHDEIHSYRFSDDAYVWVNEVVNYEGGDNYAIRRIHPNLKDTEGTYLSTKMTDITGNHPYLTELEGVKEDGELFFNYYFKKKGSDQISEKVTYAKLYKKYDWIIAMGVHLDDVQAYVAQTTSESEQNTHRMLLEIAAMTALLIIVVLIFVSFLERWYYKNTNKELQEEIYKDSLTKIYNRRAAEMQLKSAFDCFKLLGHNSAIIMIDIDDFKKVNDICGHDKGDFVLINIAATLSRYIRSTDILCRWGGEEFLLICHGLKEDDMIPFTDKLLHSVTDFMFQCEENINNYKVTVSMGVSEFTKDDEDYNNAVKRADKELYKAKAQGKNQASIEI